jgi:hypothetical protein
MNGKIRRIRSQFYSLIQTMMIMILKKEVAVFVRIAGLNNTTQQTSELPADSTKKASFLIS